MPLRIEIQGAREFRRALRDLGPQYTRLVQQANKQAAAEVAAAARSKFEAQHPSRTGHGIASIRPLATQTRAQVALGGVRVPYIQGLEFGSHQGPRKRQFPPFNFGKGNFFYPAISEAVAGRLPERYLELLDRVARSSGFGVRK